VSLLRAGRHTERKFIWCQCSFEIRHHCRRETEKSAWRWEGQREKNRAIVYVYGTSDDCSEGGCVCVVRHVFAFLLIVLHLFVTLVTQLLLHIGVCDV